MENLERFILNKPAWMVGLVQTLRVITYVAIFATVAFNLGQHIKVASPILSAITVLTAFVTSALICGSLVLGSPALLALKGQIRQAIMILVWSAVWLVILLSGWVVTLASIGWK